jgi:hypothetical protein
MATFTLSQGKDAIEQLSSDYYHDTRGHNTLTADIEGTDLSHAWAEIAVQGDPLEPMRHVDSQAYKDALTRPPDGTAISGISVRESIDVRYESDEQDTLLLVWGSNNSTDIYRADSADDPTTFGNAQLVHSASGPDTQVEDPNWWLDRDTYTLHLVYENAGSPNTVAVWDADTPSGLNYSNQSVIGADNWDLGISFASPILWVYNDQLYITGEEHDTADRDLMVAKGSDVRTWDDYQIVAESANHSEIDSHINLQSVYIDRYGTLHGYSNQLLSNGNWASRYWGTSSWTSDGYPSSPWDKGDPNENQNVGGILRLFNECYVYAHDPAANDAIHYWHLPGSRIEESVSSGGETVEFEFFEPTLPQGTTVEWRIAVEDTGGSVDRSGTKTFDVTRPSTSLASVRDLDSIHVRDADGLWPVDSLVRGDGWTVESEQVRVER